jgi:hypothetical protein
MPLPIACAICSTRAGSNVAAHASGAGNTEALFQLAVGETLNSTRVELATTLVVRESTAPPNGDQEIR